MVRLLFIYQGIGGAVHGGVAQADTGISPPSRTGHTLSSTLHRKYISLQQLTNIAKQLYYCINLIKIAL